MNPLATLREALSRSDPGAPFPKPEMKDPSAYAIWRFLNAWRQTPELGPDHAVLLRQIARWYPQAPHLGKLPADLLPFLARAGLSMSPVGDLIAKPFAPSWLLDPSVSPQVGLDPAPVSRQEHESIVAEPFLAALHVPTWKSRAQKEAAWQALTAPEGSTTLLSLPTGAGKSLCFQLLPCFDEGLTVVVVPTVALALDLCRATTELLKDRPGINPLSFSSDENAESTLAAVREKRTRLIFAAPEAVVSGRLRGALNQASEQRWLRNLVVDEAHLIATWGMHFRVDFQVLATLRRQWLSQSGNMLRTFLVSATFTPAGKILLRELFSEGAGWREFVSGRLRPELACFAQHFNDEVTRGAAALDCVWQLPRPALLYTTEVRESQQITQQLQAEGFSRVACFNGETSSVERKRILEAWRADELELVVATSAFGLGVDKPDVRSVVHACLPETLERYYQEIGRGGRDGNSTICVLLSSKSDRATARSLTPRLLRPETLQKRWRGLWESAQSNGGSSLIYDLRLDAKPQYLLGCRSYAEHVRWNKRLILQLLRARKLLLLDVLYRPPNGQVPDISSADAEAVEHEEGEAGEWVRVELRFQPDSIQVGESIQAQRGEELRELRRGIRELLAYQRGDHCLGLDLRKLFGPQTAYTCGGCRACRRRPSGRPCPPLPLPTPETTRPRLAVVSGCPDPLSQQDSDAWQGMFWDLVHNSGLKRFICEPAHHRKLLDLCGHALSDQKHRTLFRLDPVEHGSGIWVEPNVRLATLHVGPLSPDLLNLRNGREVVHFIPQRYWQCDPSGRRPLEGAGAPHFLSPQSWAKSNQYQTDFPPELALPNLAAEASPNSGQSDLF